MQDQGLSNNTDNQSIEAPGGDTPQMALCLQPLSGGATVGPPGNLSLL